MKKKMINKHTLEIDKSYIGLYHFGISTLGLLYVVLIAMMIMSLFGCAGNDGANGVNGYNSIMKQVPSIACNNGGVSVLSGIDFVIPTVINKYLLPNEIETAIDKLSDKRHALVEEMLWAQ